jgi:hypothetical protein
VGESVSIGNLWDTRRTPRGNVALPRKGALLGGPYMTLLTRGTKMERMDLTSKYKESSTPGDSTKGLNSEGPQIGAAERNPVGLECRGSSKTGDSVKGSLLEAPPVGAAGRDPVLR